MSEEEAKKPKEETEAPAPAAEEPKEEESTATFEPVVSESTFLLSSSCSMFHAETYPFSVFQVKLEEVEVKSGEEEEEVIFQMRAKLFIFGETLLDVGTGNKTWKERGIGEVRLLRHREHQRLRLLMRQEKTMKVIANHALDPRIQLEPNVGSDRSWVWSAYDFAEGELKETVFALRFADSDIANDFKNKFIECQKEMEKLLAGEDNPGEDGGAAADEAAAALSGLSTSDKKEEEADDGAKAAE